MKLRSFFSVLSGIVIVLLLIGAVGAYWLATSSSAQLPKQTAHPTTAMFVSRQSAVVVTLLANPERLGSFWLAEASSDKRRDLQAELHQLQQSLFANSGLDYERDLKAWLGDEISFALTTPDIDRDRADGLQPGYLLVLTVDDPELAKQAVDAFWQRRARDLAVEQFAGVPLVQAASQDANQKAGDWQPSLTSAIVGDRYVLFANSPKVLREALNNVQVPELSLDRSFVYQQALERAGQKLGFVFVNLAQAGALADAASDAGSSRYESLIATLQPAPQGLLADTLLLATEPAAQSSVRLPLSDVTAIAKFIPPSSRFAIAGCDLEQTWAEWRDQLPAWWITQLQRPWASLQQQWGILFPQVLGWVKDDYVLAQVPGATQSEWVFVTEQSPAAAAGLEQLDQLAQQQGISLGSFSFNNQKIFAWTKLKTSQEGRPTAASLQAEVQGVHTEVSTPSGNYQVFATSLAAMEQALTAANSAEAAASGLAHSDFQDAIAQLQIPNQGYLFLDQTAITQLLQAIPSLAPWQKQISSSFRSAALSSYGTEAAGLRGAVFLHLSE